MGYTMGISSIVMSDENLSLQARALMVFICDIYQFELSEKKEPAISIESLARFAKIRQMDCVTLVFELYHNGYVELDPKDYTIKEVNIPPKRRNNATI